jgi:histidyl-tRNA synthetase
VLRAIDKLDRLGVDGVHPLLGKGRKDESGDFTKGAQLTEKQIESVMTFIEQAAKSSAAMAAAAAVGDLFNNDVDQSYFLSKSKGTYYESVACEAGLNELEEIRGLVRTASYGMDRIRIDPSVVRGLEYYTGPVFEAELLAPIKDERGQPIRLGSVVSGGRYDGLVERFTCEKVPATGISIGVSRLLFGLQRLGKYKDSATQGPVVVLVLDRDRIADYQNMAQSLRAAGIRAELYLGEGGLKAQMKYADKRGAPCVVIQGGDEKAKGEVQIKDLILGANLAGIEDREEYLKKSAVRKVLSRHQS